MGLRSMLIRNWDLHRQELAVLLGFLGVCGILAIVFIFFNRSLHKVLRSLNIMRAQKLRSVFRELRRKGFHLAGMIYPTLFYFGIKMGLITRFHFSLVLGIMSFVAICVEVTRFRWPKFQQYVLLIIGKIMRKREYKHTSGMTWFTSGIFLSGAFFHPLIAMTSMWCLIFGDLMAAIIGKTFGTTKIFGQKSLQGSIGCFVSSLTITLFGFLFFGRLSITDSLILATVSSLTATLAELYTFGRINDNFTIPVSTCLTATLAVKIFNITLPIIIKKISQTDQVEEMSSIEQIK
ncbi:hypothetical protein M0812_05480 [Anaeramoeba flamelloides]|uniref:Phosphatidate cytidylyltransferase n=1 Tax=Anaeramoeba flamelloides TaxID=1746091 RepID=A0AAV8AAU0_9EUKA|nr:hypothetical protein M0812_05480 [Anaeramoeba flamelloides]